MEMYIEINQFNDSNNPAISYIQTQHALKRYLGHKCDPTLIFHPIQYHGMIITP